MNAGIVATIRDTNPAGGFSPKAAHPEPASAKTCRDRWKALTGQQLTPADTQNYANVVTICLTMHLVEDAARGAGASLTRVPGRRKDPPSRENEKKIPTIRTRQAAIAVLRSEGGRVWDGLVSRSPNEPARTR